MQSRNALSSKKWSMDERPRFAIAILLIIGEEASLNITQLRLNQPTHIIFLAMGISSEFDTLLELFLLGEANDFCSMVSRM